MKVDVIIPTYKPDAGLFELFDRLQSQTVPISNIIVINTEEKYFRQLVYGKTFNKRYNNIKVTHISRNEFDHGGTRRRAVKHSDADVFVMMTQDAVPADNRLIENLLKPLEEERVAVSYARQLPRKETGEIEKYIRRFNYPDVSVVKSAEDIKQMGVKAFFCSNVCAAYKKDIYDALGGFTRKTIFNEDMIFAGNAIKAGYEIAYVAEAKVFHSHNYTGKEQFKRNFDLGVSQAQHPEVFGGVSSELEGIAMIKQTVSYLWRNGYRRLVPQLFYTSVCKFLGYRLGKSYWKLPPELVLAFTTNKNYWHVG